MRIYVTGIGGFVGRHLAGDLLEAQHEVAGCDLGLVEGLPARHGQPIAVHQVDLLEPASLRPSLEEFAPEAVIHLAGFSHVGSSWGSPAQCFRINVLGTEALLDALAELDSPARVVFASSSEVYGQVPEEEQPIQEGRSPAPTNPYGMTKAAAERLVLFGGGVVARSFNLIGPGQSEQFAMPGFARQLAKIAAGLAPPILKVGDLSPRRDFVDVRDGATAYRLLAERGQGRRCFNVASGKAVSIGQVLERLVALSGLEVTIEQDEARLRPSDIPLIEGDASHLRELGWQPGFDLDASLLALWQSAQRGPCSGEDPST